MPWDKHALSACLAIQWPKSILGKRRTHATSLELFTQTRTAPGEFQRSRLIPDPFCAYQPILRLFVTCPTFQFTVKVSEVLWVSVADPDVTAAVTVRL